MENPHIIRRLIWDVEGLQETDTISVQSQLAEFNQTFFLPRLSELLDSLILPDDVVYMPELKIDVQIDKVEFNNDFIQMVLNAVKKNIINRDFKIVKDHDVDQKSVNPFISSFSGYDSQPPFNKKKDSGLNTWQAFTQFLGTGLLPWWLDCTLGELEGKIISELKSNPKSDFIFSRNLKFNINLLNRLYFQISEKFIADFERYASPALSDSLIQHMEYFIHRISADLHIKNLQDIDKRIKISMWLLSRHPEFNDPGRRDKMIALTVVFILQGSGLFSENKIIKIISDREKREFYPAEYENILNIILQQFSSDGMMIDYGEKDPKDPGTEKKILEEYHNAIFPSSLDKDSLNVSSEDEFYPDSFENQIMEIQAEGIYADHAGLVLLHPFFQAFFEELGLLNEEKKFKTDYLQQRAIHLLYYLACGHQNPTENELAVEKVLCGKPMEENMIREMEIGENEKENAHELLRAVLKHWSVLKNTSLEGLMTTFLQRPGKLVRKNGGWHISIEQHSVDILLLKLPWGLTPVFLPWNPYPVVVNWT